MEKSCRRLVYLAVTGVWLWGIASPAFAQRVIYVNAAATGASDGTSWTDAYTDLQDALAEAGDPGTCSQEFPCGIWVAAGVYTPDLPGGEQFATFQLLNNVALYGGFAGGEESLNQRDWEINETILSGDLNGDDGPRDCEKHSDCCVAHEGSGCDDATCAELVCDYTDNCCLPEVDWDEYCASNAKVLCCNLGSRNDCDNSYHVVTASATDRSAVLDGFIITAGFAGPAYPAPLGGAGLYSEGGSATINNCVFRENVAWGSAGVLAEFSADLEPDQLRLRAEPGRRVGWNGCLR